MSQPRKFTLPDGRVVDAMPVGFQTGREDWNEYLADDGSVIRSKLVVTELLRIVNEWAPDGQPLYATVAMNLLTVDAQESMKKREDG